MSNQSRHPSDSDRYALDLNGVLHQMTTATLLPATSGRTPEQVEAIAADAARGDSDSLGTLYDLYVDVLFRYVLVRASGRKHLAEDITSETWARIARSIRTYETGRSCFIAWAQSIARNVLNDHYRAASRRPELPTGLMLVGPSEADPVSSAPDPEASAVATDEREQLGVALRAIPHRQALVLVLRYFEGLSVGEVAAVMGITENNVKQLQYRAVKSLGRKVKMHLGDTGGIMQPVTIRTSSGGAIDTRTADTKQEA